MKSDSVRSPRRQHRASTEAGPGPLKPMALKEGSTIGIVAPASGVSSRSVSGAVATLSQPWFQC